MEGKGMPTSCHIISLKNDYMVIPKLTHDDELSLRMTLFEAGTNDTWWTTVITMLASRVNLILYEIPFPTLLNGIILHTPYYDNARFTSMCLEAMADARGLKVDIIEACNRSKKKAPAKHQSLRSVDPYPINRSSISYRVQSVGKPESSNRCLRSSYQA
jgi:hypothetical protein